MGCGFALTIDLACHVIPVTSWIFMETERPAASNVLDDAGERQKLYAECRNDLLKRQLSNSENFDRSVLSLSSALLAASIAFIKPAAGAPGIWHAALLAWSWVALAVAIATTMLSFLVSQVAIDRQLDFAKRYYLDKEDHALNARNRPAEWTARFNWCAGIAFGVGVILTVWFAIVSIPTR